MSKMSRPVDMHMPKWIGWSSPFSRLSSSVKRALVVSFALLLTYDLFRPGSLDFRSPVVMTAPAESPLPMPAESSPRDFLPLDTALDHCVSYDLTIYPNRKQARKVYDLFLINTELDWLEIRLNELAPYVDYFVIVEATHTFTLKPKPLVFKENFHLFERFAPQILYHVVDLSGMVDNSTWEREHYTRDALYEQVFPSLLPPYTPELDDVILVSDLDEIPRPETITTLRNCVFPERVTLRSRFFYYSFQWQHVGDEWHHPQATFYQGPEKTIRPEQLRSSGGEIDLWNASWHCSSCFSTVGEMATKIHSFSHTEYDAPDFVDPEQIVRRVRNGLDLFDRQSEHYERVENPWDVPEYLKQHRDKFAHMLDRDPENANFQDYDVLEKTVMDTPVEDHLEQHKHGHGHGPHRH